MKIESRKERTKNNQRERKLEKKRKRRGSNYEKEYKEIMEREERSGNKF